MTSKEQLLLEIKDIERQIAAVDAVLIKKYDVQQIIVLTQYKKQLIQKLVLKKQCYLQHY